MPRKLPLSLASLSRLQHLSIDFITFPKEPSVRLPLPAGPWVSSLRVLGAPFCVLSPSIELLRSASQLEHLACFGPPTLTAKTAAGSASWDAFFGFLASHPPLRCFTTESGQGNSFPHTFMTGLCRLQRSRPGLLWRHSKYGSFSKQVLQDSVKPPDSGDDCV